MRCGCHVPLHAVDMSTSVAFATRAIKGRIAFPRSGFLPACKHRQIAGLPSSILSSRSSAFADAADQASV